MMPEMAKAQEAAWLGLLDLHERQPVGWTLIGGQLVHLHCAERGYSPQRPTADADTVVDARQPTILGSVTESLVALGYDPGKPSAIGIQHRWTKADAVIDVLIVDGAGQTATKRPSASGFPTIAAPGGTQALHRTAVVEVQVGDRVGSIPRPNLLGAMILKAKARIDTTCAGLDRHTHDFAALASMLAANDLRDHAMSKGERRSLRKMIALTRCLPAALQQHPDAERRLLRLEEALDA